MNKKEEEMGLFGLILDNAFISFEKASDKIKETYPKIKDGIKKKIRTLFKILIALFIAGVAIIAIGIYKENGAILVMGRFILLPVVAILFAIAALPAIAFESIGAKKLTGERYTTFIRHFFAYQLFFNLILMLPWIKVSYQLYFYLIAATCTFTFLTAWATELKALKYATSGIIIVVISSLLIPGVSKMLSRYVSDVNRKAGEARLKRFTLDEFLTDKVILYSDGKPATWICVDDEERYVLYEDEDYCPNNGKIMQPITEKVRLEMKKYKEKIISPKNLIANNPTPTTTVPTTAIVITDPPSSKTETFIPPPDNRKEYAVIAVNEGMPIHNNDGVDISDSKTWGRRMVDWSGSNRSLYAYDIVSDITTSESGIDYDSRKELAKVAKKIIYVVYKTRVDREDGGISYCTASVFVKIIDTDTGNVIKEVEKTFPAQSPEADDGRGIALVFVLKALENQLKNYM